MYRSLAVYFKEGKTSLWCEIFYPDGRLVFVPQIGNRVILPSKKMFLVEGVEWDLTDKVQVVVTCQGTRMSNDV